MGTLTDDFRDEDLLHLLSEAGDSFPLPEDGAALALDALEADAVVVPLRRRRWVQLSSAAAAVALTGALGVTLFAGDDVDRVGQLAGAAPSTSGEATDDALFSTNGGSTTGAGPESADRDLAFSAESGRVPLGYDPRSGTLDTRDQLAGTTSRSAALADTLAPAAAAAGAATSSGGRAAVPAPAAAAPAAAVPSDGARVVKKGAIALVVEDDEVTPTLTRVQGFATAAGGVVATQASEESGSTPSGSITVRVPVDAFERVVAQVRGLPAEVRTATTSGTDVTAQYADLEAQLRTLKAARERFLAILERADSIGDVLSVQQRVDDVTGKVDRLEGQRRVLAAQSDTATLEVSVAEADDPVVTRQEPDTGLSQAFSDAGDGFTSGVEALVRLSGRGLLLLLLAATALGVGRLAWRLARRRLV